jgi:hypothetical protein
MSTKSDLVGSAGLFAAAAELARWDWLVSQTIGGAARTDLLAQYTGAGHQTAAIQVKTRTSGDSHLAVTDPATASANEWVILVSLGDRGSRPAFNIVPRNHVVLVVRVLAAILEGQGRKWTRKLIGEHEFCRYRECWDLMTAPAAEAPWMLPPWVFDGLPLYPQPELSPPSGPAPEQ